MAKTIRISESELRKIVKEKLREYKFGVDLQLIEAVNLGKLQKHGEDGFVILSANRSEIESVNEKNNLLPEYEAWLKANQVENNSDSRNKFLRAWNRNGDKKLLEDILAKGYTYSLTYGGYHSPEGVTDNYEPSFVVYNHKKNKEVCDWDELYKFALEMCGKYRQGSVYISAPGKAPNYYDAEGHITNRRSSKNMKFNRDEEPFYTTTKRDKDNPQRFTADIVFEGKYFKPALNHEYVDRMRRTQQGEIFLG